MKMQPTRRRVLVRWQAFLVSLFLLGVMASQVDSQCHAADPGVQSAAKRVTQIIAHRGASVERPECTLAAIRRAIEVGATAVEIDVRTSSDGELFLLHDQTLDRTTNGSGVVTDTTFADIKALSAGD